jgi:hypothetical protein
MKTHRQEERLRRTKDSILRLLGVSEEGMGILEHIYLKEYKDKDIMKLKWYTVKNRPSLDWYRRISAECGPFRVQLVAMDPGFFKWNEKRIKTANQISGDDK